MKRSIYAIVIALLVALAAVTAGVTALGAAEVPEKPEDQKEGAAEKGDEKKGKAAEKEKAPESRKKEPYRDADIVITATKTGIVKKETGASVSVITEEDIERSKKTNVVDLLKKMPGLSVSQSSSRGGLADLYVRGTASNHVAVLIDGVRVNNPASAGHGFDFAHLTTENIERIEIIRGAQSTLYGSDAVGGVVNIITKKGEGRPGIDLTARGGSFFTFNESVVSSGGNEWANYSFGVSRADSRGTRRTSTWRGVSKSFVREGGGKYENTSASGRVGVKTVRDSWLTFAVRYTGAEMNIADGAFEEAKNHTYRDRNLALSIVYDIPVFKWWSSNLMFSYMTQNQRDRSVPHHWTYEYYKYGSLTYTNMHFDGTMTGGEWKNTFRIGDIDEITCGVSYEQRQASTLPYWYSLSQWGGYALDITSSFPIDKGDGTWAGYVQNHLKLFKRVFVVAGVRYTRPDHFASSVDYTASGSFIIPVSETRLKTSMGTGYKIPSLYQLYNTFDRFTNYTFAYLDPERTFTWDAGVEQPLWENRIVIEATYFSVDYKNMINYDTTIDRNGRYWNSSAIARGVEAVLTIRPMEDLTLAAFYTYTRAENRDFFKGDMLRRPRHQTGASVNYLLLKRANFNASFTWVGSRRDYVVFPYFKYAKPYCRLDAAVSWQVIDQLQLFFTVDNALNRKYDEVRGYRASPVAMSGGFKVTL